MVTTGQKLAMAEVFLILAEFYKFPDEEFHRQLSSAQLMKALEDNLSQAGFSSCFPGYQLTIPGFAKLSQEFFRCFIGLNQPSAIPVESIYKVWTTDSTAQIGIAGKKGYLMGDAAIHIRHLVNGLGLEIPDEYRQRPDHLTILLELLAFLITSRESQEVRTFIDDHFDWLNDFQRKLFEIKSLPLYIQMTSCLISCIRQAATVLQEKNSK